MNHDDRTDDRIRFDVHDMTSDGRYVVDTAVGDSSDLIRQTVTAEQLAWLARQIDG